MEESKYLRQWLNDFYAPSYYKRGFHPALTKRSHTCSSFPRGQAEAEVARGVYPPPIPPPPTPRAPAGSGNTQVYKQHIDKAHDSPAARLTHSYLHRSTSGY